MGATSCLSKCLIIAVNVVFWAGAALMIVAGAVYLQEGNGLNSDLNRTPGYIAVSIGVFLFLIGLVGICGACTEKKILLWTFILVALVCLGMLIYASASMFVKRSNALDNADQFMNDRFNSYGGNSSVQSSSLNLLKTVTTTIAPRSTTTTVGPTTTTPSSSDINSTQFIDDIQTTFHCCGWTNYSDWSNYTNWIKSPGNKAYVPSSCCNETAAAGRNTSCSQLLKISMSNTQLIYSKGCQDDIQTVVKFVYAFVAWTAVASAIFVFFAFCGSIYLVRRRRTSDGFDYSSIVA